MDIGHPDHLDHVGHAYRLLVPFVGSAQSRQLSAAGLPIAGSGSLRVVMVMRVMMVVATVIARMVIIRNNGAFMGGDWWRW